MLSSVLPNVITGSGFCFPPPQKKSTILEEIYGGMCVGGGRKVERQGLEGILLFLLPELTKVCVIRQYLNHHLLSSSSTSSCSSSLPSYLAGRCFLVDMGMKRRKTKHASLSSWINDGFRRKLDKQGGEEEEGGGGLRNLTSLCVCLSLSLSPHKKERKMVIRWRESEERRGGDIRFFFCIAQFLV